LLLGPAGATSDGSPLIARHFKHVIGREIEREKRERDDDGT
jgi:hypothetical protein